jgi:putative membrane protein
MMWWNGAFGGMSLLGGLLMLAFWVAVVLLVLFAVRALFPSERGSEQESALAILKRRYAAGEISQAEYEQARRAILGAGGQA